MGKTLAILAGGKNSRMNGVAKGLLTYDGKTLIERIIEVGMDEVKKRNYVEYVIVANDKALYEKFGVPIIEDFYKNQGPMGGIHAALCWARTDYVTCVACDMPFVGESLLKELAYCKENCEIFVPSIQGKFQPLCANYSRILVEDLENTLSRGHNKLQDWVKTRNYKVLEKSPSELRSFYNVNTPKDWKELL